MATTARSRNAPLPGLRDRLASLLAFPNLPALAAVGDFLVVTLAGLLVASLHSGAAPDWQRSLGLGMAAGGFFVAMAHASRRYRAPELIRFDRQPSHIAFAWALTLGALAIIGFLIRISPDMPRGAAAGFALAGFVGLLTWRMGLKLLLARLIGSGTLPGPRIAVLVEAGRRDADEVVGMLGRYGYAISRRFVLPEGSGPEVTRVVQAMVGHVRGSRLNEIVLVIRWSRFLALETKLAELRVVAVPVKLVAEKPMERVLSFGACDLGPATGVVLKPAALSLPQRAAKRAFDIAFAGAALFALSPLLLLVAAAIRLDSPGPVIFRQQRGGYNGRRFRIFKFRTMTTLEDGAEIRQARKGDARITRVGAFLRRTSIDELPQLANVLVGDMSLVGPRPHALAHDDAYARLIAPYPARHNVKPGITGWAQVNGCRGETADVEQMRRRVEYDLAYIRDWSPWLDLRILCRTAVEVVRSKAY